ncbi:Nucleotide-diphospho-sugar transferases [Moorella glycerini]|uniref:Uncharacterized protein n=1 Tax=Neomoorella stamsii TaxID=1266720 RepID=A0A9X7J2K9_9FIRM|nr:MULTISPECIES: glycosyltransferase family 2 protein [Moorella]PRR72316.1 hypothetical protein MOST_20270 [Moorella stamsii]CEP68873.1 Nucleotide-diphospho-sugar transferases [Moorella glycerini]
MPVYKVSEITTRAFAAIGKWKSRPFEIIVIDNGTDPTRNQGLAARGEYLVVMDNGKILFRLLQPDCKMSIIIDVKG